MPASSLLRDLRLRSVVVSLFAVASEIKVVDEELGLDLKVNKRSFDCRWKITLRFERRNDTRHRLGTRSNPRLSRILGSLGERERKQIVGRKALASGYRSAYSVLLDRS